MFERVQHQVGLGGRAEKIVQPSLDGRPCASTRALLPRCQQTELQREVPKSNQLPGQSQTRRHHHERAPLAAGQAVRCRACARRRRRFLGKEPDPQGLLDLRLYPASVTYYRLVLKRKPSGAPMFKVSAGDLQLSVETNGKNAR